MRWKENDCIFNEIPAFASHPFDNHLLHLQFDFSPAYLKSKEAKSKQNFLTTRLKRSKPEMKAQTQSKKRFRDLGVAG